MAALAVVIYHYGEQRGIMAHFPGPFVVTLFFELSGLLITWLLLKEMDKREKVNLQQFYPAVRCACSLSFMSFGFSTALPGSWATFFYMGDYYYAFHQSYSAMTIAWSLGVDEKFYLLWPFFLTRIARPKLIKILCGILIAEPVYRSFLTFIGHQPYTWFAFDCRLDAIVLGCLIALLAKDGGEAHMVPEQPRLSFSRRHLVFPLSLPRCCPRNSMAADRVEVSSSQRRRGILGAIPLGTRCRLALALSGRTAV